MTDSTDPRLSRRPAAPWPAAALAVFCLAGCTTITAPLPSAAPDAEVRLAPTTGSQVHASVAFRQQPGQRIAVEVQATGLKPNQEHGFHVHEKGDCNSPDGSSAGGHFDPTAQPHGPQDTAHHGGDMPSLKADATGNADVTFLIAGTVRSGAATDLLGRAVIIHAQPDDYTTQPTGNSGARLACGVIGTP